MSCFPELPLEPKEPLQIATCRVCGEAIYNGETHWEYEGRPLCYDHLDEHTAKVIDCIKKDGREY